MSKVAIKGNASGTGTFTVEAPNSNTDRTLVLPDEAGTVLTSASTIDSSKVLPSGQTAWPSFRVGNSSDISVTATGQQTVNWLVTSGSDCFIQGGITYSSGTFTVPVSGLYHICFNLDIRLLGSGYIIGRLVYEGNTRVYVINGSPDANYDNLTGSATLKMTAGDQFYFASQSSTDSSYSVALDSSASGHLVAAE